MKLTEGDTAFALTFDDGAPALVQNVVSVAWSTEVLRVLRQIKDEATQHAKEKDEDAFIHLPYANLRAHLQLGIPNWAAMQDDVGLRSPYPKDSPEPWGYLAGGDARENLRQIQDAFARWSEGPLAIFCEGRGAYTVGIGTLRQLNLDQKVITRQPSRQQIFPWNLPKGGATSPFDVTAGYLASRLAGKEIFPGLGPVVHVVGGTGRNNAEIMTRPHNGGDGGLFSLVCEISLETLPGATRPLVYLRFKRRRWANQLNTKYPVSNTIGGFVFPHLERPNSAFRFTVMYRKKKWLTDSAYELLESALNLTPGFQGEGVLLYPSNDEATVAVMVKAEVAEATGTKIRAGVPLVDQADGFARIVQELQDLGLRPFADFAAVRTVRFTAPRLDMLKADLALARLLGTKSGDEDQDENSVNDMLEAATGAPSTRWFKSDLPAPNRDHHRLVAAVRTLVSDTVFGSDLGRRKLYLICHGNEDIQWMKSTIQSMLGEDVEIVSTRLPTDAHGPIASLPLPKGSRKERFNARIRAWQDFAAQIKLPDRAMILVQAPMYYLSVNGKVGRDDQVNKIAARKALASMGCTVQYLLPSDPGKLDKFLPRLQAAVLDLVFGHAGSVWGLKQARAACFKEAQHPPNYVAAISSLKVQTEWWTWQSAFVATRLNCASGQAEVRFAFQSVEFVLTPWMRFDEGAKFLAANRVELPRQNDQRNLLAQFFTSTLDDLAALDPNAVVFIDSTRTARLASWLSDAGVGSAQREVATGVVASARWPTLRLIRIRDQAPTIGQLRLFDGKLPDGQQVRTWTSTQRLFEVRNTAAPTYWSLARPVSHHKRGASCYRTILLPNSKRTPENPDDFTPYPPRADEQYLNPQAIEVVILHKQPQDDNAQLASFAQRLRAGMLTAWNDRWVNSPTPLRIVDKLAQYMRA